MQYSLKWVDPVSVLFNGVIRVNLTFYVFFQWSLQKELITVNSQMQTGRHHDKGQGQQIRPLR